MKGTKRKLTVGFIVLAISFGFQSGNVSWSQSANVFQSYTKPLPIPQFSLGDLSGRTVQIKDYEGKAVLLHFWATW